MKNTKLEIFLEEIEENKDGTTTIYWGYQNHRKTSVILSKDESCLYIKNGEAIIYPPEPLNQFFPGRHHHFFCMIIGAKTKVVWNFMDTKYQIDYDVLFG